LGLARFSSSCSKCVALGDAFLFHQVMSAANGHEDTLWYFAMGAMMNPVSVERRGLHPLASKAAKLLDYRLVFLGRLGMASPEAAGGEILHGVLHHMTQTDILSLDDNEPGYCRVPATALLYDGTEQQCEVYLMNQKDYDKQFRLELTAGVLPQARYIDVLCEGAEHFGVASEYVEWLRAQPSVPRRTPAEYRAWTVPAEAPTFTLAEVLASDGSQGRPAYRIAGSKVLLFRGRHEGIHWNMFRGHMSKECCLLLQFSHVFYDPLFGKFDSVEDMTPACVMYYEDIVVRLYDIPGVDVSCVGVLQG